MRDFKESLSGEPGQGAALEQTSTAALAESSTVATTSESGTSRD
jgi:hypothetical protein